MNPLGIANRRASLACPPDLVNVSKNMHRLTRFLLALLVAIGFATTGVGWSQAGLITATTKHQVAGDTHAHDHDRNGVSSADCADADRSSCGPDSQAGGSDDTCCGTGCHVATSEDGPALASDLPIAPRERLSADAAQPFLLGRLERPPRSAAL
jgi:hypothetical protein